MMLDTYIIKKVNIKNYYHEINEEIIIPDNYNFSKHKEELSVARLMINKFHGSITLLSESLVEGEKTSDYLWNNRLWELKNISTRESVDRQVRKAIKQILNNPGGIILNLKECLLEIDDIIKIVCNRVQRFSKYIDDIDIIFISNQDILDIVKIKKSCTTATNKGN